MVYPLEKDLFIFKSLFPRPNSIDKTGRFFKRIILISFSY